MILSGGSSIMVRHQWISRSSSAILLKSSSDIDSRTCESREEHRVREEKRVREKRRASCERIEEHEKRIEEHRAREEYRVCVRVVNAGRISMRRAHEWR